MNKDHIGKLRQLIKHIQDSRKEKSADYMNSGYSANKAAIMRIFAKTKPDDKTDILARLALLDSMYSTQMTKRYYGLEELADALYLVGTDSIDNGVLKDKTIRERFIQLLNDNDLHKQFMYDKSKSIDKDCANGNVVNLFSEKYGIDKEGEDKGTALSLITKYAYFETRFKFPIYESIVKEMYPLIVRYCDFNINNKEFDETIMSFLKAIKLLRNKVAYNVCSLSFDDLDCMLWTVGKILRGNMSLVFSMDQYKKYGKDFNIRCWSKEQIESAFKENTYLLQFMLFAKELSFYEQVEWRAGKFLETIIEEIGKKFEISIKVTDNYELHKTLKQHASKMRNTIDNKHIESNMQLSEIYNCFQQIPLQVELYKREKNEEQELLYTHELPLNQTIEEYMRSLALNESQAR